METRSNGSSFRPDKRERREEVDPTEPPQVGTGKPPVLLATFTLPTTKSLG